MPSPRRAVVVAVPLALLVLAPPVAGASVAPAAPPAAGTQVPVDPAGAPTPPGAAAVGETEAAVAALAAMVEEVTARLTAQTQALDTARRQAEAAQVRAAASRAAAERAVAAAREARSGLDGFVRSAYTSGGSLGAESVVAGDVDERATGLGYLDVVADRRAQEVRRLGRQLDEAREASTRADEMSAAAEGARAEVAAEVERLGAEARAASGQLTAASAALAELRRLQAEADAQAAAAPATAGSPPVVVGAAAAGSCGAVAVPGAPNGLLPTDALCPLASAPGQRLRGDAAAAFDLMAAAYAGDTGRTICITDSYRDYPAQVDVFARKPTLAAVPGTSNHGWGLAVDLCGGVEDAASAAHGWMQANAPRFGWVHPDWAEPGGSRPEPWHWEFGRL